jgi:endonuclease/exonuclease/phosphatase family metal-dependent hydrolase
MRLRVMTLNVWNTEGDSARRVEMIRRGLEELRPDLLALQEVGHEQLHELLGDSGGHVTHQREVVAIESAHAERFGGNALSTRWPHRVSSRRSTSVTRTRPMCRG